MSEVTVNLFGKPLDLKILTMSDQKIGLDGAPVADLTWSPNNKKIQWNSLNLELDAQVQCALKFMDHDEPVTFPLFGPETLFVTAQPGNVFGAFTCDIGGTAKLAGSAQLNPYLTLAGSLSASSRARYWLFQEMAASETEIDGARQVLKSIRMPPFLDPRQIQKQVHGFYFKGGLDLGVNANAGFKKQIQFAINRLHNLFSESTESLKADIDVAIAASAGWSMFDEMQLIVTDFGVENPGWVRCVLKRVDQNRISFGFKLDMMIRYNLKTGAEAILNQLLGMTPWEAWKADLKKLKGKIPDPSKLNKTTVLQMLTDMGMHELQGFLEKIPATQFQPILQAIDKIDLDQWLDLILEADLSTILSKITGTKLNAQASIQNLLGYYNTYQEWLEMVMDQDLFSYLLGNGGNSQATILAYLNLAQTEIKKVEDLVNNAQAALSALQIRAKENGVAALLQKVARAQNAADLTALIGDQLRPVVERLTGKLLSGINEEDFQKLQNMAQKIRDFLDQPAMWEAELRKALNGLKGEIGFSLAWDFERISRSEAFLDIELDPKKGREAFKSICGFQVGEATQRLGQLSLGDDYQLNQAFFNSEKTHSVRSSFIFGKIFSRSIIAKRLIQTSRTYSQNQGNLSCMGYVKGSFVQVIEDKSVSDWIAEVQLAAQFGGNSLESFSPESKMDQWEWQCRLSMTREDPDSSAQEWQAIQQLLTTLQFNMTSFPNPLPGDPFSKVTLVIEAPIAANFFQQLTQNFGQNESQMATSAFCQAGDQWFAIDFGNGKPNFTPLIRRDWNRAKNSGHWPYRNPMDARHFDAPIAEICARAGFVGNQKKFDIPIGGNSFKAAKAAVEKFTKSSKKLIGMESTVLLTHWPNPLLGILFWNQLLTNYPLSGNLRKLAQLDYGANKETAKTLFLA